MNFILGYIAGILTPLTCFVILAYFKESVRTKLDLIERTLSNAGPRRKGAIILPEKESDVARKEHIRKNRELGKDTPIDELR